MQLPGRRSLVELLGDPHLLDRDVPWAYNNLRWQLDCEEDHLDLEVEPGDQRITLLWSRLGTTLASFDMGSVSNLRIQNDPKSRALVFKTATVQLRVQVVPAIHILVTDQVD
jgi:hypothetical protein